MKTIIAVILLAIFYSYNLHATRPSTRSCGGSFEVKDGAVFFDEIMLETVDGPSFVALWDGIIKDKNNVYFVNHTTCGGTSNEPDLIVVSVKDPSTLVVLDSTPIHPLFAKDRYHVYSFGRYGRLPILADLHPSFEPMILEVKFQIKGRETGDNTVRFLSDIRENEISEVLKMYPSSKYEVKIEREPSLYHKDIKGKIYFYADEILEADYKTFVVVSYQVAVDSMHLYVRGKVVSELNGPLHILGKYGGSRVVAKDNSNVFDLHEGAIIPGVHADSFEYLNDIYSRDRKYVYCCRGRPRKIDMADPITFEVISDNVSIRYGKDKNRVYYLNKPVLGADPSSFHVFFGRHSYLGRDNNNVYSEDKVIEYEEE